MRTTVTLDPDVERMLKKEAHRHGSSFKVVLNEAVRRAFSKAAFVSPKKPFVVKAKSMGLRAGIDPTRLSQLADELEDDALVARMTKGAK